MIMISHSKTLESSMRPAEKPSMGFRLSSAAAGAGWVGTSESREGPEDEERLGVEGERRTSPVRVPAGFFAPCKPVDLIASGPSTYEEVDEGRAGAHP